jgi:alcohol dehydrogenase class IV
VEPFVYQALSQRIVFGAGTLARVGDELDLLGVTRALVLATPGHAAAPGALANRLGQRAAGVFAGAVMHTPVAVTEEALGAVAATRADAVVALGGGSTIGLGKAIALRTDLPQLVIPTTYAGSEATAVLGETAGGRKTTRRSPKILPEVVLYDVDLTLTLPVGVSVTSGMNAIAHAIEARYAENRNPLISLLALDGIGAVVGALPRIRTDPNDRQARSAALYGAWACGTCLGAVGMALHHKLCHVLGGSFGLPHAATHAVVLPHAVAYNESTAPDALRPVADLLGAPSAAAGLYALAQRLGAPLSLRELGMPEAGLDRAVDEAVANPYWNPRPLDRDRLRQLLGDAYAGRPPRLD